MKYTLPSFTVPKGTRDPDNCSHDWVSAKGECVFCGTDRSNVKLVFVPRFKWCAVCHKKARISWNGKDYCAQCLNRSGLFSHRGRKPEPILLAESGPASEVQSCDTSGSSSP